MSTKDKLVGCPNTIPLKKSASTNEVNINLTNLNLREAKSYAGTTAERKNFDPNQRYQGNQDNCFELFYKDCENTNRTANHTKDAVTNEIYYINEEMLMQKGNNYTLNEIAATWKKDCRMWLWKNEKSSKKNRSVAEINSQK